MVVERGGAMNKDAHAVVSHNLEEGFRALAEVLAELVVKEDVGADALEPKDVYRKKMAQELAQAMISCKRRIENGAQCLAEALDALAKTSPKMDVAQVTKDFVNLANYFAALDEHLGELLKAFDEGKSIQELSGMSRSTLDMLYLGAKDLYERQHYEEAANAFGILTFLNPRYMIFWLGLGNAEYFCHHYEGALTAYAFAVYVNPNDPSPHLYSAKCYEELQQMDYAINALDLALYVIQEDKTQDGLRREIEKEKRRLQQKKGG